MFFTDLPDVALLKIFQRLDHFEWIRLIESFQTSTRLNNFICSTPLLWRKVRLKSTVDYNFFSKFSRFLILNASFIRHLSIDQLDSTCRQILIDEKFSFQRFSQLESISIDDESLCQRLEIVNFSISTLKSLHLNNEHRNLREIHQAIHLNSVRLSIYSLDLLKNSMEFLVDLRLRIMFDRDQTSAEFFSSLPHRLIEHFTLDFLLTCDDEEFSSRFHRYLNSCSRLHALELSHMHSLCRYPLYIDLDYQTYQRLILINICPLETMKTFVEFAEIHLPTDFLQSNATISCRPSSSSCIFYEFWYQRELIVIEYLSCVCSSMEMFHRYPMIWSDKPSASQSCESFLLRSISRHENLMSTLRNLTITRFEISLDGLVILLTEIRSLVEVLLSHGHIDQMGAGNNEMESVVVTTADNLRSEIKMLTINNLCVSRRTVVTLSLITTRLESLTMNDVKLIVKTRTKTDEQYEIRSNFLILLKRIARRIERFRWNQLKSITLGKNMINRHNLSRFIPSTNDENYSRNLEHIRLVINDQNMLKNQALFVKSMKELLEVHAKLTSFILEFTHECQSQVDLENQLIQTFQMTTNKQIFVYRTSHDRAFRFCFSMSNDDSSASKTHRKFRGIPLIMRRHFFLK